MSDLKFSEEHEWVSVDGEIATIGITKFAQEQLGDVVFVDLPEVGGQVSQGGDAGVVEADLDALGAQERGVLLGQGVVGLGQDPHEVGLGQRP